MAQNTTYRRSLSGSIGSGVKSVFSGEGRRYYSLVHKVSSKYHKAGESQKIIVDQIELGRDPRCAVRYDESFGTVSRRHAAIVKDRDNWKLVPLSKTNSTYLNGRKLEKEWYLQNGDEIQLSTNGPKLGFIVPEGKAGLVKSIGLTARLSLFRQQALRPYKTAITSLACALVLCCGLGGYSLTDLKKENRELLVAYTNLHDTLVASHRTQEELQTQIDSMRRNPPKQVVKIVSAPSSNTGEVIDKYKSDVYYIDASVYYSGGEKMIPARRAYTNAMGNLIDKNGDEILDDEGNPISDLNDDRIVWCQLGWSGTAFLLNDGKLVTARHCIQGWKLGGYWYNRAQALAGKNGYKLVSKITAYSSNGQVIEFSSEECRLDDSDDIEEYLQLEDESFVPLKFLAEGDSDWAVYQTSLNGNLEADYDDCIKLQEGTELHFLGFPQGMGAENIRNISPMYSSAKVAASGCSSDGMIIHGHSTDHGNSGGPVMILKDEKMYVVGIVSGGTESEIFGQSTPIAKIR